MSSSLSTLDRTLDQTATRSSDIAFLGRSLHSTARFAAGGAAPSDAAPTRWVSVSIPAPASTPEHFLRLVGTDQGLLWVPPSGHAIAGSGAAAHLAVSGRERIDELRQQASAMLESIAVVRAPGVVAPSPRFFGGLAFEAGGTEEEPWRAFGDGSFLLPRWLYTLHEGKASLTYTASVAEILRPRGGSGENSESENGLDSVEATADYLLSQLAEADPSAPYSAEAIALRQLPAQPWTEMVEEIRREIRDGNFQKIVAARRSEVELLETVDPLALLHRLDGRTPNCLRFAFFRNGSCFLGATPERLVRKDGSRVSTEALAGSIATGPGQGERLLASEKDRWEHELVVRHVIERLQPFCSPLDWSQDPGVRTLRNLLHLHTPVHGELRNGSHVLELVEALHPTPAVGGVPATEARHWIAAHEATPRGWYAGPVGWFDRSGDGEFDVALRSCLVHGTRAWVYAGSGIVADSDPTEEYRETDLKQRGLLTALGVTD
ncbi:MAG: isochorismate synthase [Acidobacteriota bacterium]